MTKMKSQIQQPQIIGNREFEEYINDYIKLREKYKDSWFDQYFKIAVDSRNKKNRIKQYFKQIGKTEFSDQIITLSKRF